ncbi:MAG: FAD/NAD(P)-binding protein [Nonlabens sp.]
MDTKYDLAIVGLGPRGLYALEQYYLRASQKSTQDLPKTIIFEEQEELGVGKAWSVNQPDANWINIADRSLEPFPSRPAMRLKNQNFPEFPSYLDWLEEVMDHTVSDTKDVFHRRKIMGSYLTQRTASVLEPLQDLWIITIKRSKTTAIHKKNHQFYLATNASEKFVAQKVVLALGHLQTAISDQNQEFQNLAHKDGIHFSVHCYSKEAMDIYAFAKAISIKGLGLSMIDILRMVLEHYKGNFERVDGSIFLKYKAAEEHPVLIPFSLDGLPSVPKPLGKHIDLMFSLDPKSQSELMKTLSVIRDTPDSDVAQLIEPIASEIATVYGNLKQRHCDQNIEKATLVKLIVDWLQDPTLSHDHILDQDLPITNYMRKTCKMAVGAVPPSLDYVVGQTWRQLQGDLYNVFSHKTPAPLLADFIKIDEQTKRYSYGPPVESILQLIALEEAGILNFDFVIDPEIELVDSGFQLSNDTESVTTMAMIDAILSGPDIKEVTDPLVQQLQKDGLAQQVHEKLGFHVDQDATHIVAGQRIEGLYSLGRITKGSIYGVDAILEAFNEEKVKWWRESV